MIKKNVLVMLVFIFIVLPGFTSGNDEKGKENSGQTSNETQNKVSTIRDKTDNGNADVVFVRAAEGSDRTWTFDVTVSHPDTGWENYADGWDVYLKDGTVLKPDASSPFTRLLLHPHVGEQPFTRSQSGIVIPKGVKVVYVRAHDIVDGWGGREVKLDLKAEEGKDFKVIRK